MHSQSYHVPTFNIPHMNSMHLQSYHASTLKTPLSFPFSAPIESLPPAAKLRIFQLLGLE